MTLADRIRVIMATYPLPQMFDNLRQVGEDKYRGMCPIHGGDNRNGFGVQRYNGAWRWRCFTGDCGGGSALDIVMRREGCTLREALEILDGGERVGSTPNSRQVDRTPATPSSFLVCDKCRDETLEVKPREYGNGTTRAKWTSTAELEAVLMADRKGWELSSRLEFAIGPRCLEAMGRAL
jgi:hypothetical protein